jgi:hypothetical protein
MREQLWQSSQLTLLIGEATVFFHPPHHQEGPRLHFREVLLTHITDPSEAIALQEELTQESPGRPSGQLTVSLRTHTFRQILPGSIRIQQSQSLNRAGAARHKLLEITPHLWALTDLLFLLLRLSIRLLIAHLRFVRLRLTIHFRKRYVLAEN